VHNCFHNFALYIPELGKRSEARLGNAPNPEESPDEVAQVGVEGIPAEGMLPWGKKQPPSQVPSIIIPHPDDVWVDEVKRRITATSHFSQESELISLGDVAYDHLYNIVKNTPESKLQEALASEFSRVRSLGGELDFLHTSSISAESYVREASKMYPTDFVNEINRLGGIEATWMREPGKNFYRGGLTYSYSEGHFVLGVDDRGVETALHELNHAQEYMGNALSLERQFYDRRTAGNPLEELRILTGNLDYGPAEKAREDRFAHPYMGKDYGGQSYEIYSLGTEFMYYNKYDFWSRDSETVRFVIGFLMGWKP
jgi:hypothetical protein